MSKPEKKEGRYTASSVCYTDKEKSYNKSCNDWEEFLPEVEEIRNIIFTFFYERKLSEKYQHRCRCDDGCVSCNGTGFILNELGMAIISIAEMIAKRIGK